MLRAWVLPTPPERSRTPRRTLRAVPRGGARRLAWKLRRQRPPLHQEERCRRANRCPAPRPKRRPHLAATKRRHSQTGRRPQVQRGRTPSGTQCPCLEGVAEVESCASVHICDVHSDGDPAYEWVGDHGGEAEAVAGSGWRNGGVRRPVRACTARRHLGAVSLVIRGARLSRPLGCSASATPPTQR